MPLFYGAPSEQATEPEVEGGVAHAPQTTVVHPPRPEAGITFAQLLDCGMQEVSCCDVAPAPKITEQAVVPRQKALRQVWVPLFDQGEHRFRRKRRVVIMAWHGSLWERTTSTQSGVAWGFSAKQKTGSANPHVRNHRDR